MARPYTPVPRRRKKQKRKEFVREEGAHGSAEQDNVISSFNRPREGRFVCVETTQEALKECRRPTFDEGGSFAVAVEFEELGEQREDKGEGDLDLRPKQMILATRKCREKVQMEERGGRLHTRSIKREMKMTRRTFFLTAASTPAMTTGRGRRDDVETAWAQLAKRGQGLRYGTRRKMGEE
jgi:hypothetical protein